LNRPGGTVEWQEAGPEGIDVLFVAGEHSGDEHAGAVAKRLTELRPDIRMAAVGGEVLSASGAHLLHDLTARSVVGLVEVLKHYGYFRSLFNQLADWITERRPAVVVLVDYPGFNLRLAAELKKRGVSRKGGGDVAIYQYISPQIWAWKAKRRFKMADLLDELGVIFPFEPECYADTRLPVSFVGHPFTRTGRRNPVAYDAEGPVLALPGSRVQAVGRIFPAIVDGWQAYRKTGGERELRVLYPSAGVRAVLDGVLAERGHPEGVRLSPVDEGARASVVLMSSGTMSLNCALAGIPGAIVYRAHPVTYGLGRLLVRIEWLGIANLVLGKEMYPEYVQQSARPEVLSGVIERGLSDAVWVSSFGETAEQLRESLSIRPKQSAARRILSLVDGVDAVK